MALSRSRKLFLVDHCLTPHEMIASSGILCENDRIIATGGASAFVKEPELEIFDMQDCFAVPGFIDSHIHGAAGFDSNNADRLTMDDLNEMSMNLASHGVTTFFPTLVSGPKDQMLAAVAVLADMLEKDHTGADPAGIHIEGPFINPLKAGVQDKSCIYPVDLGYAAELFAAGLGRIKLMTFAPELENSDKLIELMMENGIIPSMGHSNANAEEAYRAIDSGVTRCTHLFNGMPLLRQRACDLTLVALTDDRVSVEIIADGGHVHPRMIDLASRAKPKGKLIGISNAVLPMTTDETDKKLKVVPESGIVKSGGKIAGATFSLDIGWFHLTQYARMQNTRAAACFTSNPAEDLGLITRGELIPGKKADITFFDCKTNKVKMTVVRGKIVYRAGENKNV